MFKVSLQVKDHIFTTYLLDILSNTMNAQRETHIAQDTSCKVSRRLLSLSACIFFFPNPFLSSSSLIRILSFFPVS